jgi:hypothetical protein
MLHIQQNCIFCCFPQKQNFGAGFVNGFFQNIKSAEFDSSFPRLIVGIEAGFPMTEANHYFDES